MTDNVYWLLEVAIKSGEYDNFKGLMEEMVASTQNEPGALYYEWHISADKSTCYIYERYADSAATLVHLGTFNEKFAARFMGLIEPKRFVVFGSPNETVKEILAGVGAEFLNPWGGFVR